MAVICDELPYVAFTQVRNAWVRDARISLKAKGLLTYLRSHAAGYRCSHAQMIRESADGKDAVSTALRELEEAGYLTRVMNRSGGRFAEDDYRLSDPFTLDGQLRTDGSETRPSHAPDGREIRQGGKSALADSPDRQTRPIEEHPENTMVPTGTPGQLRLVEGMPPGLSAADAFDTFWAAYPRRVSKDAARRAWGKVTRRVDPQVILTALAAYPFDTARPQFIPHPATWLNGGRWEDDPAAVAPAGNGTRNVSGGGYRPPGTPYRDPDPAANPNAFEGPL